MGEDPLPRLKKRRYSLRGFGRSEKKNILVIAILVIATGLFFSVFFHEKAQAGKEASFLKFDDDTVDPMKRVGRSYLEEMASEKDKKSLCVVTLKGGIKEAEINPAEENYKNILEGHPMEVMAPALANQDSEVAAFLIGIAKKESDWGMHTPKKDGRECFNFWGFKGGYNLTSDGYSCFDNPEQAVTMVGARIRELIAKRIDTPARMVVWKCGSTCVGHDPAAVAKWISDVSAYYYRLES